MKINKYIIILLCFIGSLHKAQGIAANLGYNYIGKSAGYLGLLTSENLLSTLA